MASGKASAIDERKLGQLDREMAQKNEHRIDAEQALYNVTQKFVLCEAELHKYDQMAEAIAQEIELEVLPEVHHATLKLIEMCCTRVRTSYRPRS